MVSKYNYFTLVSKSDLAFTISAVHFEEMAQKNVLEMFGQQ